MVSEKKQSMSPEKQTLSERPPTIDKLASSYSDGRVESLDTLKTFMSFFCDRRSTDMETTIMASLELFNYCIPAREVVLAFYTELFNEYSTYYWILKKRSLTNLGPANVEQQTSIEYVGEITRKFYEMAKLKAADTLEDQVSEFDSPSKVIQSPSKSNQSVITGPASPTASSQSCSSPTSAPKIVPVGPRIIPVSRRTSSCNSTEMDQTPMSPSAQEPEEPDVIENNVQTDSEGTVVDIFTQLEQLISLIHKNLKQIIDKYSLLECKYDPSETRTSSRRRQGEKLRKILMNWAESMMIQQNLRHSEVATLAANESSKNNPVLVLTNQIDLWLQNPVNQLVIDILLKSHTDMKVLFTRLVSSTQNCDFLLAYFLLQMSKQAEYYERDFSDCMEFIMDGGQAAVRSLTYILAYLSDNNPKAMANFPKSNIPFLMSLCQTSVSLLNVLAMEIPDSIDVNFINNLTEEVWKKGSDNYPKTCIESLTHCIISAPNTYKLFLLAIDARFGDKIDPRAITAAQVVIESVLVRAQERAFQGLPGHVSHMASSHQIHMIDGLLHQIDEDPSKLIEKSLQYPFSNQVHKILYRMSLIFGHHFASKVIAYYLNLPSERYWSLLRPLLSQYMSHFGDDGSTLVSQTLSMDSKLRTATYWKNLNSLAMKLPDLKLDLDLISHLLTDRLCAATLDINSTAQLIKLCCSSLERVDHTRISVGTKHRLCISLANCYFLLLEIDKENFPEILSYIRVSLTCMSLLKQSSIASHILCRALLERSIVHGHLFNRAFDADLIREATYTEDWTRNGVIKLSHENLKVTLGHRFRRLPNHNVERFKAKDIKADRCERDKNSNTPDKLSINSYLLIEAFKSSIHNIEAFANLFVEFHCPVMFDKHLWPSDEALRVINERNLSILRKFEQVPPLWDLFELIGQAQCLEKCLILVKALLAAHLALWASATTKSCSDKMISTSRLIPPLARSCLIPKAFGLTVEVLPHLSSNEVFSVLSDIWQYLKDTHSNGADDFELTADEKKAKAKAYLNRLRLFMCQHMPNELYVKIFKQFYVPTPKMIPT